MHLAPLVSAFVHESQKERGRSAVVLGSGGRTFRGELAAQRKETDQYLTDLRRAMAGFDAVRFGPEFAGSLTMAMEKLDRLQAYRGQIDHLGISSSAAVDLYTELNASLIHVVSEVGKVSKTAELRTFVSAYVDLLNEKEQAGLERAWMSAVFSIDHFERDTYRRFVSAVVSQDLYLKAFRQDATSESLRLYDATVRGDSVDEVLRIRMSVLEKADAATLGKVDPAHWFITSTDRINLMRKVERQLEENLIRATDQFAGELDRALTIAVVVTASVTLLTLGLIWLLGQLQAKSLEQAKTLEENARLFAEIQEKNRELNVSSQHKSQFLASMSHELRTPLNAILGFNEMILDEIYGPVPADVRGPLENIQTSGKHLMRLINNVLDLAKIEAGRMELVLTEFSVHDTVEGRAFDAAAAGCGQGRRAHREYPRWPAAGLWRFGPDCTVPDESRREFVEVHQGRQDRDRGKPERWRPRLSGLGYGHRNSAGQDRGPVHRV
jgi:signal transduction histidine kinase